MLHFLAFFEFLVALVGTSVLISNPFPLFSANLGTVLALGLALNLDPSGFTGWPIALVLILVAVPSTSFLTSH